MLLGQFTEAITDFGDGTLIFWHVGTIGLELKYLMCQTEW